MVRFIPTFRTIYVIFTLILTFQTVPATGEILTIEEDFSSTLRRDNLMTSAVWDTLSLNVHLHSQVLFSRGTMNTTSAYMSAMGPTHLFVADGTAGLRSLDISDPDNPTETDVIACDSTAKGVALSGEFAFVAVGSAGMQVIDVSDPAIMVDHGSFDHNDELRFVNAVAAAAPAVYLAESDSGMAVFDTSNPAEPIFIRHVDTGTWARDVHVSGNYLYVADDGLKIFDISNPFDPTLVSETPVDGTVLKITVSAGRAYIACGASGLFVFDISDPALPVEIRDINLWGTCQQASASDSGDIVFVAAGDQGLSVLDITDPLDIITLGIRDTVQMAMHTLFFNDLIYLANLSDGLKIFEINPDGLDPDLNLAQSKNLNDSDDPVSRINLTGAITDSVAFEVTADGGITWHYVELDGEWFEFPVAGSDIRWRASLAVTESSPVFGPAIFSLSVSMDRLASFGTISSVSDVPHDSGLQVRLRWQASRHDFAEGEYQITEYSIYRRFDGSAANVNKANQPSTPYPPGNWDFLTTIPADMESQYSAVVSTLADSNSTDNNWAAFFIRTRTSVQGVFFDSPPDSGYSVNNLQPAPPTGWVVDYSPPEGTQLSWNPPGNPQFAHFRLYRSSMPNTPVQPATLFDVTTETSYFDETNTQWYYQLTLVTMDGLESLPANLYLSGVGDAPSVFAMGPNAPNPFNPATIMNFVTGSSNKPVHLDIFDARGRKIRSFLGVSLVAGQHQVRWDGKDNTGRNCASGVYHAQLRQGIQQQVLKMTLVR